MRYCTSIYGYVLRNLQRAGCCYFFVVGKAYLRCLCSGLSCYYSNCKIIVTGKSCSIIGSTFGYYILARIQKFGLCSIAYTVCNLNGKSIYYSGSLLNIESIGSVCFGSCCRISVYSNCLLYNQGSLCNYTLVVCKLCHCCCRNKRTGFSGYNRYCCTGLVYSYFIGNINFFDSISSGIQFINFYRLAYTVCNNNLCSLNYCIGRILNGELISSIHFRTGNRISVYSYILCNLQRTGCAYGISINYSNFI